MNMKSFTLYIMVLTFYENRIIIFFFISMTKMLKLNAYKIITSKIN